MKITVQCECGNSAIMQIIKGKAFVVRDNLAKDDFYCKENTINEVKNKETLLQCNKCKNWVILDWD